MPNDMSETKEDLKQAFEQLIQNPIHHFIVNVRRKRASQLRELLSSSHTLDTTTFEREVWHLESQTYWRGREIGLQLFDKKNGQSRLEQILQENEVALPELESALNTGALELHGNYIWGQATNRYAPKQASEDEKVAQIRQVIDILNDAAFSPIEKAHRIDSVPGFGENNTTGLVMVFHPEEFALVNTVTRAVLEKLDTDNSLSTSLDRLQRTLHALKEQLGAKDFLELDWFLYQYSSYLQEAVTSQEKQTWLNYVVRVLENTNEPLSYTEITSRAIALGLQTKGKTPAQTVSRILTTNPDLFERVSRGKYRLLIAPVATPIEENRLEDSVTTEQETNDLPEYVEPALDDIFANLEGRDMQIEKRLLRRYHLALKTDGIVILAGPSGTGKTWLAEAYAEAIGAAHLLVPVAPNWTTNEDFLGYSDPLNQEVYHDTPFSSFLRQASKEYEDADAQQHTPRPYHVILDEMNLARVEYYFAKFLSVMEERERNGSAYIALGPQLAVSLYANLHFIGTINIDETTHGFADKVYDRAEVIQLSISPAALQTFIGDTLYQEILMQIWNDVHEVAPFAFRVIKGINGYINEAERIGVPWQEALDEEILQKVLPRCKGHGGKVGTMLKQLTQTLSADVLPLSNAKVLKMLEGYKAHGIASYF